MLVRDGEGATRVAEVRVEGARTRLRPTAWPGPWRSLPSSRRRSTAATPTGDACSPPSAGRGWTWTSSGLDLYLGDVWVAEGGARASLRRGARAARRCSRTPSGSVCGSATGSAIGLDVDLRPLEGLRGHQRALPELTMASCGAGTTRRIPTAASGGSTARSPSTGACSPRRSPPPGPACGPSAAAGRSLPTRPRPSTGASRGPGDGASRSPAYLDRDAEDVHSFVEERLGEAVGELAGQAHLGRSRNEQAVTALRLWIRGAIDRLRGGLRALVEALVEQGRRAPTRSCPASRTRARPSPSRSATSRPPTPGAWFATRSGCATPACA